LSGHLTSLLCSDVKGVQLQGHQGIYYYDPLESSAVTYILKMQSFHRVTSRGANEKTGVLILMGLLIASLFSCAPGMANDDKAIDYEILLIGNSHSSKNDLPGLLAALIESGLPSKTVHVLAAPSWGFLDDHLKDKGTRRLLEAKSWTHVVLQGQKYSSSGRYTYPTDAAEEWIRRAKTQGAMPIMFPEWPRRGNTEEGQRIHELHEQIVTREPACIAPVGLAWEMALRQHPSQELHERDGNHSNASGALLTAYVLYEIITGKPATELPNLPNAKISPEEQQVLRRGLEWLVDWRSC